MPRHAIVTVLLSVLVAGCASPPADDGDEQGAAGPLTLPFGLRGCNAALVVVAVPHAALAPHLPEGFRSLPIQELVAASAPNPRDEGNFGVEMFVCDEADGVDGPVAPAIYGSYFSLVEPPEELREDVTLHAVKWDVVVADPAARGALIARGVPAWGANASFARFDTAGPGVLFEGEIAFDSGAAISFEGGGAAPFEPLGSFVEYTQVPAGLAAWRAQYTWEVVSIGPATVQASGPGLASDILGTEARQGTAFAGIVDFHDGNVTVPG